MIEVNNLTKSYGVNKGVFDLSFTVNDGEVFGFIGPNGAGKTTTIRQLLGFVKADAGSCQIMQLDSHRMSAEIQKHLGYLPGEIAFFDHMTGIQFLTLMANLRNLKNLEKMQYLIDFFELDISGKIRKMSKGMKQKVGLVSAFMHDPKILILDEPTSGLDPLMQTRFVELILKEKKEGKTVLMSSHSFEEIERTCDRAAIIKDGVLVALEDINKLKENRRKIFVIKAKNDSDIKKLINSELEIIVQRGHELEIAVSGDIMPLIRILATCEIESMDVKTMSLEEIFMLYYKKGDIS
ncbi:MAG: ABC transporter ATP-binding protein [Acholeplasmataceae bacterium]|nr:ABC transporter ATP-binding protein [Acholeplasmataceae bacterium]